MAARPALVRTRLFSCIDVTPPADPVPSEVVRLALALHSQDEDNEEEVDGQVGKEEEEVEVLLLGEGDFAFAVRLVGMLQSEFSRHRFHVIASDLANRESLAWSHEGFAANVAWLEQHQLSVNSNVRIEIRFGLDARVLSKLDRCFDLIVFNFLAHSGPSEGLGGSFDLDYAVAHGFFASVRSVMSPGSLLLMANQELEQGGLVLRRNACLSLNHSAPARQAGLVPRWTKAFPENSTARFYEPSPAIYSYGAVWWLFSCGPVGLIPNASSDVLVLTFDARPVRCVVVGDFYPFRAYFDHGAREGNLDPCPLMRVWLKTQPFDIPPPKNIELEHLESALQRWLDAPPADFLEIFTCLFFEAVLSRWSNFVLYCLPCKPSESVLAASGVLHRAVRRFNELHQLRGGRDYLCF